MITQQQRRHEAAKIKSRTQWLATDIMFSKVIRLSAPPLPNLLATIITFKNLIIPSVVICAPEPRYNSCNFVFVELSHSIDRNSSLINIRPACMAKKMTFGADQLRSR